jgi:hypothetical protein
VTEKTNVCLLEQTFEESRYRRLKKRFTQELFDFREPLLCTSSRTSLPDKDTQAGMNSVQHYCLSA